MFPQFALSGGHTQRGTNFIVVTPQETPHPTGPILQAQGVTKRYESEAGEVIALRDLHLTIEQGEFVTIMGPSGSGKTTLLNCLSLLDDIDEGSIILAGSDVRKMKDAARTAFRGKHMGFIFQAFNLIPVFTAAENVELPLLLNGANPRQARAAAVETLEKVGLAQRVNHRPNELSGGEQQRVAVARALAGRPRIVWADEPTGNLDSETAKHVVQMLAELHRQGMTVMLVTHDPQIGGVANRLIQMRDGQIIGDKRRPA
jgi:putative ABC transport system ATP-binding protein